jgi:hypothetical protein
LITVAVTGDIPENFVLFGLGFLLLFVGHLLIAPGLRHSLGRAWVLPLVGAVGILVAITLDIDPVHDIGLFVFEGGWVALGVALLRASGSGGDTGRAAEARALMKNRSYVREAREVADLMEQLCPGDASSGKR